jgi:hypothetical protein
VVSTTSAASTARRSTSSPDVLDAFGSFDFVSTDLIPVAPIRESLGGRPRRTVASDDVPF